MTPRLWQPLGSLESSVLPSGGEGGSSLSAQLPEGSQGLGLGQAKPPVLARGCSAAPGLFLRLQGPAARTVCSSTTGILA